MISFKYRVQNSFFPPYVVGTCNRMQKWEKKEEDDVEKKNQSLSFFDIK